MCTRHGLRTLAVDRRGGFHWNTNVRTSSDFQFHGRVEWRRFGVAAVTLRHSFSCAHPGVNSEGAERRALMFRREGERLRVAITDASELMPLPSRESDAPTRWMVFRRVDGEAYYRRFLVRLCPPTGEHRCDPGCFGPTVDGD